MDASTSPDHITRLQRSLGLYLQDNPPLTEETFGVMIELAQRLHNAKLEVGKEWMEIEQLAMH